MMYKLLCLGSEPDLNRCVVDVGTTNPTFNPNKNQIVMFWRCAPRFKKKKVIDCCHHVTTEAV